MPDFFDKLEKARSVYQKHRATKEAEQLAKSRQSRVEDLYQVVHQVGDVSLPIPSLFAMQWLATRLGGLESLDLSNMDQLCAIIWILENQDRPGYVNKLSSEQIQIKIDERASQIPAVQKERYIACISDMLTVIKKNSLAQQENILESVLELLDSTSLPNGD